MVFVRVADRLAARISPRDRGAALDHPKFAIADRLAVGNAESPIGIRSGAETGSGFPWSARHRVGTRNGREPGRSGHGTLHERWADRLEIWEVVSGEKMVASHLA
jgi:hypothetical protein